MRFFKGSFTNYVDKKTYIHGWGNVNESPLGIHTWSTICQRVQNFPFLNEVEKYVSESILFEKHQQNKNSSVLLGHRYSVFETISS